MKIALRITALACLLGHCGAQCDSLKTAYQSVGCCDPSTFASDASTIDVSGVRQQLRTFENSITRGRMPTLDPENLILTHSRYMYLFAVDKFQVVQGDKRINAPRVPTTEAMNNHSRGAEFIAKSGTKLAKAMTLNGTTYAAGTTLTIVEYQGQIADFVYEERIPGYTSPVDGSDFAVVALNAPVDVQSFDGFNMFMHASSFLVDNKHLVDETGKCLPKFVPPPGKFNTLCSEDGTPHVYPWVQIIDYAIDEQSLVSQIPDIYNNFCLLMYTPTDPANFLDLWEVSPHCYAFVPGESKADFPIRLGEWFQGRV